MSQRRSVTVMVISGDEAFRPFLASSLTHFGFRVMTVSTGAEGIEAFEHGSSDVILVEEDLPDGSGHDVCQRLGRIRDVPIVMLAEQPTEVREIAAFQIGIDDYVSKTVSIGALCARMLRSIERYTVKAAPADEPKTLWVDRNRQVIGEGDVEVPLTGRELKLCEVLIGAPQRVFSRETLLDRVWGLDSLDLEVRTVDAAIARLRKKLQQHFAVNPIETVPGSGYRYRPDTVRIQFTSSEVMP